MANSSKPNSKKFFDVAKPGKTMPSSSSRPAIVGHRTLLKDPMMTEEMTNEETNNTDEKAPVSTSVPKLQPLTDAEKETAQSTETPDSSEKAKPEPEPQKADIKKTAPETSKSDKQPAVEEESTPKPDSEPANTEEKADDAPDNPAEAEPSSEESDNSKESEPESATTKKEADKLAEKAAAEAAAKQEALEKVIADKTYFLPIGQKKRRRSAGRSILVLGLIILLLLAFGYLAVDSGMVKTTLFEPPIRLFKAN